MPQINCKACKTIFSVKDLEVSGKLCNFALANHRRAPLCERHTLFASCEDALHVAVENKLRFLTFNYQNEQRHT